MAKPTHTRMFGRRFWMRLVGQLFSCVTSGTRLWCTWWRQLRVQKSSTWLYRLHLLRLLLSKLERSTGVWLRHGSGIHNSTSSRTLKRASRPRLITAWSASFLLLACRNQQIWHESTFWRLTSPSQRSMSLRASKKKCSSLKRRSSLQTWELPTYCAKWAKTTRSHIAMRCAMKSTMKKSRKSARLQRVNTLSWARTLTFQSVR